MPAPRKPEPEKKEERGVKVESKKEKKSQKDRPHSKKKHAKVQVWKLYSVKDGKVTSKEYCPRCGPGTILAQYKNRKYCGKCGWSQIKTAE